MVKNGGCVEFKNVYDNLKKFKYSLWKISHFEIVSKLCEINHNFSNDECRNHKLELHRKMKFDTLVEKWSDSTERMFGYEKLILGKVEKLEELGRCRYLRYDLRYLRINKWYKFM